MEHFPVKLVKCHNDDWDDIWVVHFQQHKDLIFKSKEDLEKYINGKCSEEHGTMEYERVITTITHEQTYDIDWA